MAFVLVFTERYRRGESRFLRRHPEIRRQYDKTLELLEANPFHPSLRLHPLKGRLASLHSVSIDQSVLSHYHRAADRGEADHPGERGRSRRCVLTEEGRRLVVSLRTPTDCCDG